jgi:2-Cys peroxiredoxin 5
MDAWAKDQNVSDTNFLTMMGDPSGALTSALGMTLNHPGPMSKLGYERCKRFAMYLVDGVIKYVAVAERGPKGEEDPAGDDFPESTLAPAMIEAIKEMKKKAGEKVEL